MASHMAHRATRGTTSPRPRLARSSTSP